MEGKGKYYEKGDSIPKYEIRIKSERGLTGYLRYAYTCLEKDGMDKVVIKGVGNAMNRVVDLAELVKRRIKGLYSDTEMESQVDRFDETRFILSLKVTLSKTKLDDASPGYQEPIDETLVTPYVEDLHDHEHEHAHAHEEEDFGGGKHDYHHDDPAEAIVAATDAATEEAGAEASEEILEATLEEEASEVATEAEVEESMSQEAPEDSEELEAETLFPEEPEELEVAGLMSKRV
eukprot:CAMPEP_0168333986 /NCGR_PEP_ID=MMETSP0213-20121227/9959_1 /TAXON_ID=151035 /ORGANISM="Euplotes harpa, Strain FSP1.4" /LENGTH=233 /DNA_ID=CAMNT_0008338465 /DNA_START=20 /DNA_END=722 /DNA_ORIENTATION=-